MNSTIPNYSFTIGNYYDWTNQPAFTVSGGNCGRDNI